MNIKNLHILLILLIFLGCAPSQVQLPQKALIKPNDIKEAIMIEEEINSRSTISPPKDQNWFVVIKGTLPIIITAPHATAPLREGNRRFSDGGGTAALSILLNKFTDATVIYTNYAGPSDPNYYDDNSFKETLRELIESIKPLYILDIHGSHPYRPYDVDFGTMNGQSLLGNDELLQNLITALKNEGIYNFSNNYFAGSKNQTIIKFASVLGIPSIQLEISSTWLSPSECDLYAHRFSQLLQALIHFIENTTSNN